MRLIIGPDSHILDGFYDSPSPNKNSDFFSNERAFHGAARDARKGAMKKKSSYIYIVVCRGLSKDDVGPVEQGAVFQKVWPGAGFKIDDFVKEMLGGTSHRRTSPSRNEFLGENKATVGRGDISCSLTAGFEPLTRTSDSVLHRRKDSTRRFLLAAA